MFEPKKCREDCVYQVVCGDGVKMCTYIFQKHEMRGCDPGPGCTRYAKQKKKNCGHKKATWDVAEGKRMWERGCTDRQIGEALGAKPETVRGYRRRVWEKEGQ